MPRRPEDPRAEDRTAAQLTAAVTAAHAVLGHLGAQNPHDGPPVGLAAAWIRPGAHQPMHFLVGGAPYFPPAGQEPHAADEHPLSYPPGATARAVPAGEAAALFGRMPYWLPCLGSHDALRMGDDERALPAERRGSFDDSVAHLPETFAWLVLAEPVPYERLERERAALSVQLPRLRQRENSEADRVAAERAEARYRELTRALATGVWTVRVLVGAERPESALASAALLCGAGDLDDLPYVLVPTRSPLPLADALAVSTPAAIGSGPPGAAPFIATAELVAALARPPQRELPGIRTVTPNRFDVTADDPGEAATADGFLIGDILDESLSAAGRLHVSRSTLNRHAFVCGATGSGKSQTVRSLLTALSTHERPIPWLAVEPAKAEYARMAGRLATAGGTEAARRVTVIRPGSVDVPPASLNPLEPEPGFPLQSHVDLVRALFLAAFEGHEPFPQVLARALSQCYTAAGWDLVTGEPRPPHKPKYLLDEPDEPRTAVCPTLGDLQSTARQVVEMIGYGKEVTADVRGSSTSAWARCGRAPRPVLRGRSSAGHRRPVVRERGPRTGIDHERPGQGLPHRRRTDPTRRAPEGPPRRGGRPAAPRPGGGGGAPAAQERRGRTRGRGRRTLRLAPRRDPCVRRGRRHRGTDTQQDPARRDQEQRAEDHAQAARGGRPPVRGRHHEPPAGAERERRRPPPGRAAVAADGMDRPVLTAIPHGEHDESTKDASAAPPLLASRSPLCGASCRREPCTLRTMNDSHHRSVIPLHLIWVEVVAMAQAMGMAAPEPSGAVRSSLTALPERDLECTLVYVVERAVGARESLMRDEVDPADFAGRLYAVLSCALRGVEPPDGDLRRYTYANFRFRDVISSIARARKANPDGPHSYPEHAAQWAARGLILTGTSGADHRLQVHALPGYGPEKVHARVGDVDRSGLRDAVAAVTGGTTREHVARAFALACSDGPLLNAVVAQAAVRVAMVCAEGRETRA